MCEPTHVWVEGPKLSHFDRPSIIREFIQNCADAIIRVYDGDLGHLKWEIRDSPELSAKKKFAMGGRKTYYRVIGNLRNYQIELRRKLLMRKSK